jgi:multidrug efflux pump subunit AcrB
MRLPKLAIENHQFTIVFVTLLVLFGVVSFFTMPRSEDPAVSPAGSNVIIIYPGATPEDIEELILKPLEEAINELDDIKKFKGFAGDGLALIEVEFHSGTDPDDKYAEVVQKVNSVRSSLPNDILSMEIMKWEISGVSVLQLALVSDKVSYKILEKEGDRLKKAIEKMPGVKRVKQKAYPEQEIRISLDFAKLATLKIPFNYVLKAIRESGKNLPGGYVDVGRRRYNIKTSGSYETLKSIRKTIVYSADGQIIRLKDVAAVEQDYENKTWYAVYNGKPAILINVSQKENTNIFGVMEGVNTAVERFKENQHSGVELVRIFDQSTSVSKRMNEFFSNLLQGLILVGIVVFLALGTKASLIVIIVIPISIMIGVGWLDLSAFGLEQMSIAGLVIALGLLVDNAIVVIENISRFMSQGYGKKEAAVKGASQIAWAVISSTATTVLAFVPMLMMKNITGDFIRSMPVTVVYTLAASLFISLSLTPYLANKFFTKENCCTQSFARKLLNREVNNRYRNTLNLALKYPGRFLSGVLLIFLISLSLFGQVGVSFFPKAEKPQFLVNMDTPDGSSLRHTAQFAAKIDSVLHTYNNVKHTIVNVGHGNPRIYYNEIPKNTTPTHSQIYVELEQYEPEQFQNFILELRERFNQYSGVRVEVKEFKQGPPVEAPIAIKVIGENLNQLKILAAKIENIIQQTDGAININNPMLTNKTDLRLEINREKAAMLGVALGDIDLTVRAAISGLPISTFRDGDGKEYDIVLHHGGGNEFKISDLENIYIASMAGEQIPLKQLAKLSMEASPMTISHHFMERGVTLTADVNRTTSVDIATKAIINEMDKMQWPSGYRYEIGGELESREESFGGMLKAIIIAVVGIFGVLVLQFRSYKQPLIVFTAIPLAIIGSIFALLVTGYSFSFTAFIGLTSLVGIVINNSIILVDYTNQLRAEGKEMIEALKIAGETRFTPIVLTTATTVGGLLPLTLAGGSLWAPMGWTIIGGLLVSTFLTLIIVPVMYKLYH